MKNLQILCESMFPRVPAAEKAPRNRDSEDDVEVPYTELEELVPGPAQAAEVVELAAARPGPSGWVAPGRAAEASTNAPPNSTGDDESETNDEDETNEDEVEIIAEFVCDPRSRCRHAAAM